MIGLGILSLIFGSIENISTVKSYKKDYRFNRTRYSLILSAIITLIGIILFTGIVFKINGIV